MTEAAKDTWAPHHLEIQKRWQPLVEAAGLHSKQHGPDHTFMLATAILKDSVVQHRAKKKSVAGVLADNAILVVLNEMGDSEKEELQRRIIFKYKAKVVAQ